MRRADAVGPGSALVVRAAHEPHDDPGFVQINQIPLCGPLAETIGGAGHPKGPRARRGPRHTGHIQIRMSLALSYQAVELKLSEMQRADGSADIAIRVS